MRDLRTRPGAPGFAEFGRREGGRPKPEAFEGAPQAAAEDIPRDLLLRREPAAAGIDAAGNLPPQTRRTSP
jgi:hypothetical protein